MRQHKNGTHNSDTQLISVSAILPLTYTFSACISVSQRCAQLYFSLECEKKKKQSERGAGGCGSSHKYVIHLEILNDHYMTCALVRCVLHLSSYIYSAFAIQIRAAIIGRAIWCCSLRKILHRCLFRQLLVYSISTAWKCIGYLPQNSNMKRHCVIKFIRIFRFPEFAVCGSRIGHVE